MPNMKQYINKHNAKILREKPDMGDTKSCYCRSGQICPVNDQCLVYQANVKCQNTVKTYYRLTELTFKERFNKHKCSFRDPEQQNSRSLSTYLSKCKSEGLEPEISWSIKARARVFGQKNLWSMPFRKSHNVNGWSKGDWFLTKGMKLCASVNIKENIFWVL